MKVWRGFTLTIWVVLLTLCVAFATAYRATQTTILNQQATAAALAHSTFYETVRDQLVVPEITDRINDKVPDNRLLTNEVIQKTVASTLSVEEIRQQSQPVLTSFYRWLDSKEPSISFSVSFADKEEAFYRALEVQLTEKIDALPTCESNFYPPEEALLTSLCLPPYATPREATQAVMSYVRTNAVAPDTAITEETFTVPSSMGKGLAQLPTYLNMAWSLNWVAIALFVLLSLFVLITRRAWGLLAIGLSLVLGSLVIFASLPLVARVDLAAEGGLSQVISTAFAALVPPAITVGTQYALISLTSGLLLIAVAGLWIWVRRKHHAKHLT